MSSSSKPSVHIHFFRLLKPFVPTQIKKKLQNSAPIASVDWVIPTPVRFPNQSQSKYTKGYNIRCDPSLSNVLVKIQGNENERDGGRHAAPAEPLTS